MNMMRLSPTTVLLAVIGCLLAACHRDGQDVQRPLDATPVAAGTDRSTPESLRSAGKLSAPIVLAYTVTGTPVVGKPVSISVDVTSPMTDPITLHYRMSELGSMTFPESQAATVSLAPLADTDRRRQQFTVVPQREGRIYVVVSAEVETESGTMMKSMSIPIQVGRSAAEPTANGSSVQGTDGELGASLPAEQ